jgi:CheY-like chemotaxis protein
MNNTKKRILVVDDESRHQESATKLLNENYELEIVTNPDEAKKRLGPNYDEIKEAQLMEAAGFPKGLDIWDKSISEDRRKQYWKEREKAHEAARLPFPYDIVLLDLMMPATRAAMGNEGMRFVGQLMTYGYSLAYYAIQNGAKMVGVLTDTNHHMHPMSAALDSLHLGKVLSVDGSKFVLAREYSIQLVHPEVKCEHCGGSGKTDGGKYECYRCNGTGQEHVYAKDWKKLVNILEGVEKENREDDD